uniref:C2H2-type domain-containing protein n=1 Tax=Echeneis naucrates TaxID=173247 RepID=A0A665U330_ECHNA
MMGSLIKHYQKTHDCSECGKSFSSVAGLTSHASLHTGSRRFKCDVCNKTFKYMSGLSVHHWVHVADKPHKCAAQSSHQGAHGPGALPLPHLWKVRLRPAITNPPQGHSLRGETLRLSSFFSSDSAPCCF